MTYLGWYDPDKKKPAQKKLEDAIARYRSKWGRAPAMALVNHAAGPLEVTGVEIRYVGHVPTSAFFVGEEENDE